MRAFLAAFLLLLVSCSQPSEGPGFDFTHVEKALEFYDTGDEDLFDAIAASDAARHLKKHSDRTGYYEPDATALDITGDLLKKRPDEQTLTAVKDLIAYAKEDPERIAACFSEPAKYLPAGASPRHPVYITWGYDIGVSMDGTASLNFAHPTFLHDREEIWFYCIHENHHAGITRLHPMPPVSGIKTAEDLLAFVRYATFLEGSAVYAAYAEREQRGALDNDPDYVALRDQKKMAEISEIYFSALAFLEEQDPNREMDDFLWSIVEEMSSKDRWWYVTGAHMARTIDEKGGREALLKALENGPDGFFKAYREATGENEPS